MPKTLLRFIYHFVKPYKGVAILFVTIALLAGLWGPLNTWLLKYIVDTSALASPRNVSFLIWPAVLLVLNFIVFDKETKSWKQTEKAKAILEEKENRVQIRAMTESCV